MTHSFISTREFAEDPYCEILGFPRYTSRQINSRIRELEKLGITGISFVGPTTVGKLKILGKGYVGVVVLAKKGNKKVALKIRRTDSQRDEMKSESVFLKLANSENVGPKMISASRNFLVMEYLDGIKISEWVQQISGKSSVRRLKLVIRCVLEDCYRLDMIGFDHGELYNISKHVIVEEKRSAIIDFESSSVKRRPTNVTSVTQAIFIGSGIAKKIQRIYRNPSKESIIDALKCYKQEKSRDNFE